MRTRKIILSRLMIAFALCLSLAFTINVTADNNSINNSESPNFANASKKKYIMDRTMELVESEGLKVVVAHKAEGQWQAQIKTREISEYWGADDEIALQTSEDMSISSFMSDNICFVSFREDDFQVGSVATLLFHNLNRLEYKAIFVNFTDSISLVFQSDDMRKLVMRGNIGGNIVGYILSAEGERRYITVLPDQSITEVQEGTGIIPPHEIELGEDVLLYRHKNYNKEQSEEVIQAIKGIGSNTSATAEDEAFLVYDNNNQGIKDFQSPFTAISYIVNNDLVGHYVKDTGNDQEIFRYDKDRDDLYYLFCRSQFEGTVDAAEAKYRTIQKYYMHVVRADGVFGAQGAYESIPLKK